MAEATSESRQTDADTARETNVRGEPIARQPNGRWLPGHSPNPLGTIKKAPTVLDETVKLAHKARERKRIARAWVDTMAEAGTAPGNRARADFSDRVYGLPKQTLVLEQGDSPLAALLADIAAAGGMTAPAESPYIVEGESRILPTDTITT